VVIYFQRSVRALNTFNYSQTRGWKQ